MVLPIAATIGEPGSETSATITTVRPTGNGYLVRIQGISSREAVARLTGQNLRISRENLPPLSANEFYVDDLIGCSVEDGKGQILGIARTIYWNGAHDVLVIGEGEGERLVPVVPEYIVAIDRAAKRVVVNLNE